jgi:NAD-dependent deacetylase
MKPPIDDRAIKQAADLIKNARHAVVLTGAGISTPSEIPDFRSAGSGLWTKNDPMWVASYTAFRHRPQDFFDWLQPLARLAYYAQPNPAHYGLVQMEKSNLLKAVITQNIDDLHHKAGSENIIEIHGSMRLLECPQCQTQYQLSEFVESFIERAEPPRCRVCASFLKPGITLYEEMLPAEAWNNAQWHSENCDVMLVIGSSLETIPAGHLPVFAIENNAHLIINTFSETPLDLEADLVFRQDVVEFVTELVKNLL